MNDGNLPAPVGSGQPYYLVMIPSTMGKKVLEYIPIISQNTAHWHFTLPEAVEVRERYIEKMKGIARSTSDEKELALISSLISGVKIVPSVEH